MNLVPEIENHIKAHGFEHFGLTPLSQPLSLELYRQWLDLGYQGEMTYLRDHEPLKADHTLWQPKAKSAIVVTKNYLPHPYPDETFKSLRLGLYAQGGDYHEHFKGQLEELAKKLRVLYSSHEFLCFTDSAPILERDLAVRAGLGWIGKNSCLIDKREGSLFWIGQILTSLEFTKDKRLTPDHCGTCTRCLDACPTQALESARKLNATKCISYWTIEAKTLPPVPLLSKFNDWFFGCDICQTVCPWNEKAFGKELMQGLSKTVTTAVTPDLIEDLKWILESSHKQIQKRLTNTPLIRARPLGLKRNALFVIGNLKIQDLKETVRACAKNEKLKEIAHWTLSQLGS